MLSFKMLHLSHSPLYLAYPESDNNDWVSHF